MGICVPLPTIMGTLSTSPPSWGHCPPVDLCPPPTIMGTLSTSPPSWGHCPPPHHHGDIVRLWICVPLPTIMGALSTSPPSWGQCPPVDLCPPPHHHGGIVHLPTIMGTLSACGSVSTLTIMGICVPLPTIMGTLSTSPPSWGHCPPPHHHVDLCPPPTHHGDTRRQLETVSGEVSIDLHVEVEGQCCV
ncbi:hypothetical protein ACOMHN_067104 [Nucella lapillus]